MLDVGSMILDKPYGGSIRKYAPRWWNYTGVDVAPGAGVDVVLDDAYRLPFPDKHFDLVASTNALEHSDFFWLLFVEMVRVARGYIYINVPSDLFDHGGDHGGNRWVDSWRFYRDAGSSLERWAHRQGYSYVTLSQAFVSTGPLPGFRDTNLLYSVRGDGTKFRIGEKIVPDDLKWVRGKNRCWRTLNDTIATKARRSCFSRSSCPIIPLWEWCCGLQLHQELWPRGERACREAGFEDYQTCCTV